MDSSGAENKGLELLVLQATPFCNINCDYCYLPHRQSKHRMNDETIQRTLEQLASSGFIKHDFTIVWHAGEPFVLPPAYYDNAIQIIKNLTPRGITIQHAVQSNGTLITQAWCDLFKEHDINIGLSIDGPQLLHDRHRRTRRGTGTHEAAMRGAQILRENEIDFHVIMVLTREALEYPDEILEFFAENEIKDIAFNIDEIEGVNKSSTLEGSDMECRFSRFFERLLKLVKHADDQITIREFTGATQAIAQQHPPAEFNQQIVPFRIISVDWSGNISTFSPELLGMTDETYGNFVYANVHDRNSIPDIVENEKFRKVESDIQRGVSLCRRTCDYFSTCGGGAPSNKLFENGTFASAETLYCRLTKKRLLDVVLTDIEGDLHLSRNRREAFG